VALARKECNGTVAAALIDFVADSKKGVCADVGWQLPGAESEEAV
jgi:hypothetical protein